MRIQTVKLGPQWSHQEEIPIWDHPREWKGKTGVELGRGIFNNEDLTPLQGLTCRNHRRSGLARVLFSTQGATLKDMFLALRSIEKNHRTCLSERYLFDIRKQVLYVVKPLGTAFRGCFVAR
jgi:hypothetical protein